MSARPVPGRPPESPGGFRRAHRTPEPAPGGRWGDLLAAAFGALTPERAGDDSAPATIQHQAAGPLGLFRIRAPARHVDYRVPLGSRPAGDVLFLNLLLRGTATVQQDGRHAEQRAGNLFALDSGRPFHKHFTSDFEQLCFLLPLELLGPRSADVRATTALGVPSDTGIGAVIAAMLRALAADPSRVDRRTAATVGASLADLLAVALAQADRTTGTVRRALLRQAALDVVATDLGRSDLSPAHVARTINVSVRYLHQLFADHGVSFGRWVLQQRLEHCRRDLANPAWDHLTIGAIAVRWGFADPSHFARAFRVRYGRSPREYRRSRSG